MFDDIRPFCDEEIHPVIQKLINTPDFQSSVAQLALPLLFKLCPWLAKKLTKYSLDRKSASLTSVNKIQLEVAKHLKNLIDKSAQDFTYHGLNKIDPNKPALFISNHRDIVLDAALINLAIFDKGFKTVESAVGDNLLTTDWVSDLMRLNKSFIVKRSEKTKRAMLTASKDLSGYIHHALTHKKENIWIAQREGRAKDGIDKTNPALISMLLLNKEKNTSICEYLSELNIIPVAISYEFDPCDSQKAIELATKEATGEYNKSDNEDLQSISQGLLGQKGHIHLEFCPPLTGEFANSKEIAHAIDKVIINNYKLFDSNLSAFAHLNNKYIDEVEFNKLKKRMKHFR